MSISIGKYIGQKLKQREISHLDAAKYVGLSKSAFDKALAQDDIYVTRLIKLSQLLKENLFTFYHDKEPIRSFVDAEQEVWQTQIDTLKEKVADQAQIISNQEEVIRLLKEKEEFLGS